MAYLTIPLLLAFWEVFGRLFAVKTYILPLPSVIFMSIWQDFAMLMSATLITGATTLIALMLSIILAVVLAVIFYVYKGFARASAPLITLLQVTPLVAIIPLMMLYVNATMATIISAVIIATIPLFVSLHKALAHENADLDGLFALYHAKPLQRFHLLKLPQLRERLAEMLPLTANLALIGTVVGEFTTSSGGGLAMRLLESQYRLNNPRLFACLFMLAGLGLCLQFIMQKTAFSKHLPRLSS